MLGDHNTSYSLICAVFDGRLERVKELLNSFGLSYSKAWSEGYVLLRDAVACKHTEVAKLLLTNSSKVNSKNKKNLLRACGQIWRLAQQVIRAHGKSVVFCCHGKHTKIIPITGGLLLPCACACICGGRCS
jgi:hypothetical protein